MKRVLTIRTDCTDEELRIMVAERVAGLSLSSGGSQHYVEDYGWMPTPLFSTCATTVLPLLINTDCNFTMQYDQSLHRDFHVGIWNAKEDEECGNWNTTFARAACFALLKHCGVTLIYP